MVVFINYKLIFFEDCYKLAVVRNAAETTTLFVVENEVILHNVQSMQEGTQLCFSLIPMPIPGFYVVAMKI